VSAEILTAAKISMIGFAGIPRILFPQQRALRGERQSVPRFSNDDYLTNLRPSSEVKFWFGMVVSSEAPMLRKKILSSLLFAVASMLCAGCGSPSHSDTLSAAQAQAISQQVSHAVAQALSNASASHPLLAEQSARSLSAALGDIRWDQSSACTVSGTGHSCNFPLSASVPCPGGGTVSVSGDIQGMLNSSGTGSFDTQITITPANCTVSNVTFNGAPDVTIAGTINITNTAPSFPVTLLEGGGISFGPNPSGSCQLNVTYTLNSLTSCAVSGTVCGKPVNGSC